MKGQKMSEEIKALHEVVAALTAKGEELSEKVIAQTELLEKYGDRDEQLGKDIGKLNDQINGLLEEKAATEEKLAELEAKLDRPQLNGTLEVKTLADKVIESDHYKQMVNDQDWANCKKIDVGSFFERKTLTTGATSAGPLIIPAFDRDISRLGREQLRIRNLISVTPVTSSSINFTKETGFFPLSTTASAAAIIGATEVEVTDIEGWYVNTDRPQRITVGPDTFDVTAVTVATRIVSFAPDTLTAAVSIGDSITSQTFAPTAETATKPAMNVTYSRTTLPIETLAVTVPVSEQALADAGMLSSIINEDLVFAIMLAEDQQILFGSGTTPQLTGIVADADTQTLLQIGADTDIDTIRKAMTLAQVAQYGVDTIVVSPTRWQDVELTKDGEDRYMLVPNISVGAPAVVWRLNVVVSTAMPDANALVGGFAQGARLYDRQESRVSTGYINEQFKENMLTMKAEERIALGVKRPENFVYITFI
jgi:hypothetical protein